MDSDDFKNTKDYFNFIITAREKLLQNYRDEIRDLIQHITSLMSILGLLGGFGFTAFDNIEYKSLFFLGEAGVISGILHLIYRTKNIITGQPMGTEEYLNNSIDKAKEIKIAILNNDHSKLKRFASEFIKNVNDTSSIIPKLDTARKLNRHIWTSFWLSAIGIVLIVISFIKCLF